VGRADAEAKSATKARQPVAADKELSGEVKSAIDAAWSSSNKTFAAWICTLVTTLLKHRVADHLLVTCAPMCAELPEFAAGYFEPFCPLLVTL
jgi:hypothetical protein